MTNDDSAPPAETLGQVTGEILFRERIMLRPGTVINIKLLQTSPADAAATELAEQVIENPKAPPIAFTLEYAKAEIDERLSYGVRATVKRGDQLLLTTDTHYPVLTRGAGNSVDLMLVAPAREAPQPDASLDNAYWKLISIEGEPYRHATKNREPHIQFRQETGNINGFTGCNDFTGGYSATGDTLELAEIAATQKACLEGMDIEQKMMERLRHATRFKISGNTLVLLQDETPILEFEAVHLK